MAPAGHPQRIEAHHRRRKTTCSGSELEGVRSDPAASAGAGGRGSPRRCSVPRRAGDGAAHFVHGSMPSPDPVTRRGPVRRWRAGRIRLRGGHWHRALRPTGRDCAAARIRAPGALGRRQDRPSPGRTGAQSPRAPGRRHRAGCRCRRAFRASAGSFVVAARAGRIARTRHGPGCEGRPLRRKSPQSLAMPPGRKQSQTDRPHPAVRARGRHSRSGGQAARMAWSRRRADAGPARKYSPHRATASARWGLSGGFRRVFRGGSGDGPSSAPIRPRVFGRPASLRNSGFLRRNSQAKSASSISSA